MSKKVNVKFIDESQTQELLPKTDGNKVYMTVDNDQPSFFGAKNMSKAAMAFSSTWIAVLTIMKGFGIIDLEVTEIAVSGLAICAPWCPTYVSIWLDKIKSIRFGDK